MLAAIVAVFWTQTSAALDVPPKPTTPVVDQTNTLTPEQLKSLEQTILSEEQQTGNQIGILMVASLEGQPIENYSLAVARGWGIGGTERNSGVLLLVAKDDRKLRIEVGYGLEGALPDIRAGQIIRDRISPEFRQNNYFAGIQSGLTGIVTAIHGEHDSDLKENTQSEARFPWEFVAAALFIVPSWLGSMLARTKSWWAGGVLGAIGGIIVGLVFGFLFIGIAGIIVLTIVGLLFDKTVSANYQRRAANHDSPSWWAGGPFIGGGGGGDGGWGGFSGGGFGGGGASGDW